MWGWMWGWKGVELGEGVLLGPGGHSWAAVRRVPRHDSCHDPVSVCNGVLQFRAGV